MRPRSALRPAQLRVIEELKESLGLALAMPMGSGKTGSEFTAIREMLDEGTIRAAVVTAPVRVALTTWPNETQAWEHLQGLDYVVLAGSPERRKKLLAETHEVYICSLDNTVWLIDALRKYPKDDPRWDLLVIDELSRFKNPRGERAKKLNRFAERFGAIHGLTGTPRPNRWEDLWMPLNIISAGEAWKPTSGFDEWRKTHFIKMDWQGYHWEARAESLPYFKQVIDTWVMTIPPDQATDIPFNSGPEYDVIVPLTKAQQDDLASLEKELLVELGAEGTDLLDPSDELVVALSKAAAGGKMAQILQGFLYRDGETVQTYGRAKLQALDDLLTAIDGENVIIAYHYRHDFELLKAHLPGARWIDQDQTDDEFVDMLDACKRGEVPYLLAHPASLGHGIDGLQGAFTRLIDYEVNWSPEFTAQMIRRIARPGQKQPVYRHRILADHWYEHRRVQRVESKMAEEAEFISQLRTI